MFKKISWQNPLKLAKSISLDPAYNDSWIFLHSGLNDQKEGSKSYLALYPNKNITSNNFFELEDSVKKSKEKWFGYFSYDLKNRLEDLAVDQDFKIKLPNLWFINFNLVLEFDFDKKLITCFARNKSYLDKIPQESKSLRCSNYEAYGLKSNFTKQQYIDKVKNIKERIKEGDLYQANLTRKFFGQIDVDNEFDLFLRLNDVSPANYSSFMRLDNNYIISSSPELFLEIIKKNKVKSSPIKGTSPRFKQKEKDILSKEFLQNCKKERAENLMIVDLVRNDLSRTCKVNSVKVENLFKVDSYQTIHHMSSDIIGLKDTKFSNIDVVRNCFPPASMTGTPKIKAMEVCSELEEVSRGIYSGAIGHISKNDLALSVVIRTVIIQDGKFEFQVGGAITHGSKPNKEWEETINKARGLARAIGLKLGDLKKL